MKSLPTAPAPGSPVSASLIGEIIAAIRARTLLRGRGYRLKETPNGTVLDIDAQARAAAAVAADKGRFAIVSITEEEGSEEQQKTYTVEFRNPYYDVGGRTYEMEGEES